MNSLTLDNENDFHDDYIKYSEQILHFLETTLYSIRFTGKIDPYVFNMSSLEYLRKIYHPEIDLSIKGKSYLYSELSFHDVMIHFEIFQQFGIETVVRPVD